MQTDVRDPRESRHSTPHISTAPLDDRTVAYVVDARASFEDLRQVASQLAGLLVLAAAGAKTISPDHPMLGAARGALDAAADHLRHIQPTARADAHHREMLRAIVALDAALTMASTGLGHPAGERIDGILAPLRTGYAHLQRAAERLPGFEMVSFAQGCCAAGGPVGLVGQVGRVGQGGK